MTVRLLGMLKGLSGVFMFRQVILFSMLLRGGAMGVGGQIVEFSSFPMRIAHTGSRIYTPKGTGRYFALHQLVSAREIQVRLQ